MGRCGCARAGQASRHIRAERARTLNRSQSGFVPVAAEPRLWTDSSAAGTGFARGGHERDRSKRERGAIIMAPRNGPDCSVEVAPGGVEPPRTDSKSVALSAELRGRAQQRSGAYGQFKRREGG